VRLGAERVGPRGALVLGAAGVIGAALAVHGYGRGVVPAGSVVTPPAHAAAAAPRTTATAGAPPTGSTTPRRSSTTTSAPSQKLGPLLSSTQYAPYAFEIYPGAPSAQARLATTGFHINVTSGTTKITVHVTVSGSSAAQNTSYALGDRVYFVETTLGDDSGDSDYNLGDDGIVVTDPNGRIVQ
jgi:hypothetical protein